MNKRNMETLLQYILVAADEIEESDAASGETTHDADALRSIAEDAANAKALNALMDSIKHRLDTESCAIEMIRKVGTLTRRQLRTLEDITTDPLTYLGQPQQPPASS